MSEKLRIYGGEGAIGAVVVGLALAAVLVAFMCLLWRSSGPGADVALASAAGWPEIRDGVPEAKPATRPNILTELPNPASAGEIASSPAASHSTSDLPAERTEPDPAVGGASASSSTNSTVIEAPAVTEAKPASDAGVSADEPVATVQTSAAASTGTVDTPQPPSPAPARAEITSAITPPPRPTFPAAVTADRSGEDTKATRPKTSEKRAARKDERQAHQQKPSAQRTRTAAAPLDIHPAPAAGTAPPPPPQEDRVRFLGVPLPTGREIKDCLLTFRC